MIIDRPRVHYPGQFANQFADLMDTVFLCRHRCRLNRHDGTTSMRRLGNEELIRYRDGEWGVPVYDDKKQFEFLMMEGMQCDVFSFIGIHRCEA